MDKRSMYTTAQVIEDTGTGLVIGEYVAIVEYHQRTDIYTVRSQKNVFHMVDATSLDHFVL